MIAAGTIRQIEASGRADIGAAVRTTPVIVVARGCTLLIYVVLAFGYGIDRATAPLFYAWGITASLGMILGTGVEQAFVPISLACGLSAMMRTLRKLTALSLALLVTIVVLGPSVLRIVSAFRESSIHEIQLFLIAFTPGLILQLCNGALRGIWTARSEFQLVATATLFDGLLQLAFTIVCLPVLKLYAIPAGVAVGGLACFLKLKRAFAAPPESHREDPHVAIPYGKFLAAQILGTAMVSFNPLIDQTFASFLDESAVTVMSYAARFFLIPTGLLISGYLPVFLSAVSRNFRDRQGDALHKRVYRTLAYAGAGSAVLSVCCALFLSPLVALLRSSGITLPSNTGSAIQVCQILLAGTAPYILMMLLSKLHIACMNYRAIWIGSGLNVLVNIVLDAALYRRMGLNGIALATTLDYTLVALVLFWLFRREQGSSSIETA